MDNIKVSIITVCYNAEKTIRRTIESVLGQTYSNIEYVIVDGKSTDNTLSIIKEYASSHDSVIRWISEPDNGIYDAMNKGISMASGDLIGIINSDDWYETDAVELVVNRYIQINIDNKYTVFHGETYACKDDKLEFIARLIPKELETSMGSHPSCFVTKDTYERFGKFDLQYSCVADNDLMLRFYKTGMVHFEMLDEHIANAELGGMSSTSAAYVDLVKFRYNIGTISKKEKNINIAKAVIADRFAKLGLKPIRIRR